MLYAQLDVDLPDSPDFVGLSLDELGLWTLALAYCRKYATDGFLPSAAPFLLRKGASQVASRLVQARRFEAREGGYFLVDYATTNQTREQIESAKAAAKERKQRWAEKQGGVKNESKTPPPTTTKNGFGTRSERASVNAFGSDSDVDVDLRSLRGSAEGEAVPPDPEEPSDSRQRYREAYETGISRGKGGPYAMARNQDGELHTAILTFAKSRRTGKALTGERLTAWISVAAEDFARWLCEQTNPAAVSWYSSFNPKGFLKYLNEQERAQRAAEVGS